MSAEFKPWIWVLLKHNSYAWPLLKRMWDRELALANKTDKPSRKRRRPWGPLIRCGGNRLWQQTDDALAKLASSVVGLSRCGVVLQQLVPPHADVY